MRAALAPWMMNALWATKKGRVTLDELMVFNMLRDGKVEAETAPEDKAADLQQRCNSTFMMLAEAARAKR